MTSVDATGENEEQRDGTAPAAEQGFSAEDAAPETTETVGEAAAGENAPDENTSGENTSGETHSSPADSGAAGSVSDSGDTNGRESETRVADSGDHTPQDAEASSPFTEEDDQTSGDAMQLLFEDLLRAMGVQGTIRIKDNTRDQVTLEILNCPDASLIIGRHGQTVDDLQYLGGLILNSSRRERKRFMLNVENYRERREETLRNSAITLARQVAEYGQEAVLDPLPPHERRIVHLAVMDMPEVYTYSEGQEPDRRIVISPRNVSVPAANGEASGANSGATGGAGYPDRDLNGEPLVGVDNAAFGEGEMETGEPDLRSETEFGLGMDPGQGDALAVAAEAASEKASEPVVPPDLDEAAAAASEKASEPLQPPDLEEAAAAASEKASEPVQLPETPAGGGSHNGHTGVDAAD